jgi:diacylglycerol kinase family enzyme
MRLTLFHNPNAGDEDHSRKNLIAMLREAGHDVEYQNVKAGNFAVALAFPGELVVCAGGDGTVRKLGLALLGRATPLAILPLGTANNIANSLGLCDSTKKLIARIPTAKRTLFDAGVVHGPWGRTAFLESFGIGLFPRVLEVAAMQDAHPIHRKIAHLENLPRGCALFRKVLQEAAPVAVKLRIDGEDVSGKFLAVQIMNIPIIGANLALAPKADMSDGKLDVVLIKERHRGLLDAHLEKRVAGGNSALKLPVMRGNEIEIGFDSASASLDDELWPDKDAKTMREVKKVTITVQPGALHVLSGVDA